MSGAMSPIAADHPLKKAWDAYQETEDFKNSKNWALRIAPFAQSGSLEDLRRNYEIMSFDQRERHVMGSLWACFMEGYNAALADAGKSTKELVG